MTQTSQARQRRFSVLPGKWSSPVPEAMGMYSRLLPTLKSGISRCVHPQASTVHESSSGKKGRGVHA